eukprot:5012709-Amphidinium_carterae.1
MCSASQVLSNGVKSHQHLERSWSQCALQGSPDVAIECAFRISRWQSHSITCRGVCPWIPALVSMRHYRLPPNC